MHARPCHRTTVDAHHSVPHAHALRRDRTDVLEEWHRPWQVTAALRERGAHGRKVREHQRTRPQVVPPPAHVPTAGGTAAGVVEHNSRPGPHYRPKSTHQHARPHPPPRPVTPA